MSVTEKQYGAMTKEEKIKFHEKELEELDSAAYVDDEEEECYGKYMEMKGESCAMCAMRKDCMAEMPSKLDQALETMGVDLKKK